MSCCKTKPETGRSAGPEKDIRKVVAEKYGEAARRGGGCCGSAIIDPKTISAGLGYTNDQMNEAPEGSNLGLGCGNPTSLGEIEEGQTVLDLGSGAGFDVFLAARKVGENGRVIGVDMTPEMLDRARSNAKKAGIENVDFRYGHIEDLPVESNSVDVIISNCVINLSPEKKKVFAEAYRVLKPGGKMMVSDIMLERPLPESVKDDINAYVGCVAGASLRGDYLRMLEEAGFMEIAEVSDKNFSDALSPDDPIVKDIVSKLVSDEDAVSSVLSSVRSVSVLARKGL